MHFNKTAFFFGLLIVADAASAPNVELDPQPIPAEEILPIEGSSCGCISFPQSKTLSATNVIMSSGSYDGPHLLRLNGKTLSFARKGAPSGNPVYTNKYSVGSIQLVTKTRQVEYQKACDSYPAAPSEGSCWVGSLKLSSGKSSSITKIVVICGC